MNPKVLFVDDDDENLSVCVAACEGDFPVLTANSAEAALECMKREEVGVIVADQRMPGTTGVELLEKVKGEYPDTVRVLITAYSDISAAIEAINRGWVRRYLKKPWDADELKAELRDALNVYAMGRKVAALEVRLRETERVYALGVVAASISHEIRNPMMYVTNGLSFAQKGLRALATQPEAQRFSTTIEEIEASLADTRIGVDRVLDIIAGIELSSKSESIRPQVIDLAEVLRLSLRLVSGEVMRSASLELDVTCAPKVQGSATKLGQVVLNLIVNAIRAVSSRPREQNVICVRLRDDGDSAVLEVADNGPGVPEGDLDRIFDPFFTTKPGEGTGLGLAISRKIVQDLNGSLVVLRDGTLGGACFTVRLPL